MMFSGKRKRYRVNLLVLGNGNMVLDECYLVLPTYIANNDSILAVGNSRRLPGSSTCHLFQPPKYSALET